MTHRNSKVNPFISCHACEECYLTDPRLIHGEDGMRFIHFVATNQFIKMNNKSHYLCVDSINCLKRQHLLEEARQKELLAPARRNYGRINC